MKKLVLTIAIVLGIGMCAFAQKGDGLFGRGESRESGVYNDRTGSGSLLNLPSQHGETTNAPAAPLGGGAMLLIGFGAAYMAAKKRKED